MRTPISHSLLLALALCTVRVQAAEQIVPIDQEPKHQLKFSNQHLRFFDVQLPPGYRSLWHFHVFDGVFVNIEASATREQELGAEWSDRPPRIIGQTYFLNYATKAKVHRVENSGETTYRVTDTEILRGCGGYAPVQDGLGQTLIVENERVRVTRLMIGPGETLALHPPCGMLVSVSGGELKVAMPNSEERVTLLPAGFKWRETNGPLEMTNVGTEVFHGVDIVVK